MTKKNVKTSGAIVVYKPQTRLPPQNKKKNRKKKGRVGPGKSDMLACYRASLSAPFSITAQGARVPDMYSCPTVTRHITKSFTVVTNSAGEADLVVLPSAFHHAVSPRNNIPSGVTWSTLSGATAANALVFTSPGQLANSLVNYRIVGYGVRIFGVASMTNTAGRAVIATVPIASWINDKTASVGGQVSNAVNAAANVAGTLVAYGVPVTGAYVDIASLPSLPNTVGVSMMNLSERQMIITPKITGPEAFVFNETTDNAIGFNIVDQTSVSFVASGDASYLRVAGFEGVVIGLSGCPPNVGVLEVELVYHLEGQPTITNNNIVGDSPESFCAPVSFLNTLQAIAKTPTFKQGLKVVGNSIYPGLGTLASRY
ncbi:coat protein [Sclerophthora macrospora virus B]|uniref:coat protein n=1 Tax=Sclerophthora macrospora virus B TaxID=75914 RepID=UPI00000EEB68|nr:coat protein [Sclerophthora macrospora virus B]BAA34921.1 coat protein [Sclerophthora macrospora virus B]